MDPNNNPYQPQDSDDDQQAGQQPPVTDGDLASVPQQHPGDFSYPPDIQYAQDAQQVPYTGPPADDTQAASQLPPPDEIPADKHYLELEKQLSAHNVLQTDAPAPQPVDMGENVSHASQQPYTETTVNTEQQNPLHNSGQAEVQENAIAQQPYTQEPAHTPEPNTAHPQQLTGSEDADSNAAWQQPQPATDYTEQTQAENNPQPPPPGEQEQQIPWWEVRPPAEDDEEVAYQAQLPPKPEGAGQGEPAIRTFKRGSRGAQDAQQSQTQTEASPQPADQQPSSLDFALPPVQQLPSQTPQSPDINLHTDDSRPPAESPEPTAGIQNSSQNHTSTEPVTPAPTPDQSATQQASTETHPATDTEVQNPAPIPAPTLTPNNTPTPASQQTDHGTYQLPTSTAQAAAPVPAAPTAATEEPRPAAGEGNSTAKSKLSGLFSKIKKLNYKPMVSAAVMGIVIFGVFNSQVIIGQVQYLTTPAGGLNTASGTVDANAPVGDEARIIIPRLNVDVPVVYDEPSFEEEKVQQALERGVVHYGNTAVPGEKGNNVIVGHSSNNWWDSGKYKFAFILLDKLEDGDEIVLHYEGERYVYEVHKKFVVEPTDVSVLTQTEDPIITLITCTPPGTSWQRLIVQARQISPDPAESVEASRQTPSDAEALPSDSGGGGFFNFLRTLF